jgi:outer membrane protein OmpA-like peptidoglycan-associated protein
MRERIRPGAWGRGSLGLALVAALLVPSVASSQGTLSRGGFDVQQFRPMPSLRTNYFSQPSSGILGDGEFELGVLVQYADDVLVIRDTAGDAASSIVGQQLWGDILFAYGVGGIFEVGVDLPIILVHDGDDGLAGALRGDGGAGLGDIRVVPALRILDPTADEEDPSGIGLGFMLDTYLPTGDEDSYRGEGTRVEPRLALDYFLAGGSRFGVNLGYTIRPEHEVGRLEVDDTLTYGLGAEIALTDTIHAVGELFGEAVLGAEDSGAEETPLEYVLGLKFVPSEAALISVGGGSGLIHGFGTPDYRIFLAATFRHVPVRDTDGDGLLDDVDVCVEEPEDRDGFMDEDGCPDPDNDGDGIADTYDACPNDPEDADGFEDQDGCVDPDNDGDGLLDGADECPDQPEDIDAFEDGNGCPDYDNDMDGVGDLDDQCPLQAEDFDGNADEDGCPELEAVVLRECEAVELREAVYFETDSDVIMERSFRMLNEVAELLEDNPSVRRVRIEGHTDDRGRDAHNLDLSQRRAQAVLVYLVEQNVGPERLESQGLGESRPVAPNDTEEGRATNRRVEIHIVEQEGCIEPAPGPVLMGEPPEF